MRSMPPNPIEGGVDTHCKKNEHTLKLYRTKNNRNWDVQFHINNSNLIKPFYEGKHSPHVSNLPAILQKHKLN